MEKKRGSVKSMTMAMTAAAAIQMSCLPWKVEKSNTAAELSL